MNVMLFYYPVKQLRTVTEMPLEMHSHWATLYHRLGVWDYAVIFPKKKYNKVKNIKIC